ncbi:DUF3179 domain-containing protein [Oceanibacterium hippocampi]|uniref:DUF3179 domain-containing protein n=1 Tax=Oceanibacterium hippocampi TaxID=745714 RepID=A0A1Y5SI61_9PROT|nr:DUF3179 domain-containing protein [Oceanibacterium hippocampi]SLN41396.1 hypothetical protein OCH7691_01752 [Oceanibacterium hippocampi]
MTRATAILMGFLFLAIGGGAAAQPAHWQGQWPNTDFTMHSVPFEEILSGGPPKDGIPAIDEPRFRPHAEVTDIAPTEPVIGLVIGGEARAYPLRILMWHEIVNDEIGGVPVAVTFCPLCNTALVFDRRLDGDVLDFGTTGKLRNSDLVMYDRQSESWWQQFTGEAIVGRMTGKQLRILPSRLESFARFVERAPDGQVLVPNGRHDRAYGFNPYEGYDSRPAPYEFFKGDLPVEVAPLARIVAVGEEAWSLDHLRSVGQLTTADGVEVSWTPGQNSALDSRAIGEGVDVGNVVARRRVGDGWEDVPYRLDFAFAWRAFHPDRPIVNR